LGDEKFPVSFSEVRNGSDESLPIELVMLGNQQRAEAAQG
jgi:hypothetical protein